MKTLQSVIFLILLSFSGNIIAQSFMDTSTLYLSAGANIITLKDQFQSPYTFQGTEMMFHLSHVRFTAKNVQNFNVGYSKGKIGPVVSPDAKNSVMFLNYALMYRVTGLPPNLSLSFGGGLGAMLTGSTYLPEIEQPDRYVTANANLEATGRISYTPDAKNRVGFSIRLPLIGLAYRPNFKVDGREYFGMNTLVTNPGISGILEYEYRIGPYYGLMFKYLFSYYTFPDPRMFALMQNAFTAGFNLKF
jgi:hypothetical protein